MNECQNGIQNSNFFNNFVIVYTIFEDKINEINFKNLQISELLEKIEKLNRNVLALQSREKDLEIQLKKNNDTLQFIDNYKFSRNHMKNYTSKLTNSVDHKIDNIDENAYHSVDSYLEEIKTSIESEQKMNALLSFQSNKLNESKFK